MKNKQFTKWVKCLDKNKMISDKNDNFKIKH